MLKYDPVGTFEFSLPTIDAEEGLGRGWGGGEIERIQWLTGPAVKKQVLFLEQKRGGK